MATATVDVGTGTIVVFTTSSAFAPKIRSVKLGAETVSVIDISNLATTGYREKMQGDLKEPLTVTIETDYNPSLASILGVAAQTVTVTFPIPSGGSAGATIAGTAFLSSEKDADISLEDKMTATYVIQYDGFTGPTITAAT
jgi:hypothetical protein